MNNRNQFFASVFSRELDKWKKSNCKTQADFSVATGIHPNSLTKYKKGEAYPTEPSLLAICKELGVEPFIFVPHTFEEHFEYDPAFRKWVDSDMKHREIKALRNAGIEPQFWNYLWSQPDALKFFPFSYQRSDSKKLFLMSISDNEIKIWITEEDLQLVSKLQKEINAHLSIILLKEALPRFTNSSEDTPLFPMLVNLTKALSVGENMEG